MLEKLWRLSVTVFAIVCFACVWGFFFELTNKDTYFYSGLAAMVLGPLLRAYLFGASHNAPLLDRDSLRDDCANGTRRNRQKDLANLGASCREARKPFYVCRIVRR